MTLYNADGSEAEMSGNGIRCLAAAVRRTTAARGTHSRSRRSPGLRTVTSKMEDTLGYGSVAMGDVTFGETLPGTLGVAYVGNPHVVVRDDLEVDRRHARRAGRRAARSTWAARTSSS